MQHGRQHGQRMVLGTRGHVFISSASSRRALSRVQFQACKKLLYDKGP